MGSDLRAVIVIDYQNLHLTAHGLFMPKLPRHEALIDPFIYATTLIRTRNTNQRPGHADASLRRVLVYRGLPSAEHDPLPYARNLAQKAHWERDRRVTVEHRPLKYSYERDAQGHAIEDGDGKRIVKGKEEKGVDVLCALAVVREAAISNVELVILATTDSDLAPALDEACRLKAARIETASWYDPDQRASCQQLRPLDPSIRLWNTRLGEQEFQLTRDRTAYV